MTCRIVLITHGPLAEALCQSVSTMREVPKDVVAITLGADRSLSDIADRLERETFVSTLILTDLPAGTPTNAACRQLQKMDIEIVTGVNLPMVLSAIANRDRLSLPDLARKVRDDAQRGILNLRRKLADRPHSD